MTENQIVAKDLEELSWLVIHHRINSQQFRPFLLRRRDEGREPCAHALVLAKFLEKRARWLRQQGRRVHVFEPKSLAELLRSSAADLRDNE